MNIGLTMKTTRIDHNMHGGSYFSEHEWELCAGSFTPPSPAGYFTTSQLPTDCVLMMRHPAGYEDEWHTAPAPVLGSVLTGKVRIQTSDMETRILYAGHQFLAFDVMGKGHRMCEATIVPMTLRWLFCSRPRRRNGSEYEPVFFPRGVLVGYQHCAAGS